MAGDAHAELVRLVGDNAEHLRIEELADLERLVTVLLLLLHNGARGVRARHLHIAAPGARAFGLELALAGAERLAGRPQARPADAAHLGAFLLGQPPGAVLLGLDLHAGRDAEMQIDLAPERFPMAVAVDEAGQHGLAAHVDGLGAGRDLHLADAADRAEAVALNDDDGILDRGAAGAVDERAALDDERLRLRAMSDQSDTAKQRQQQSCNHKVPPWPVRRAQRAR